MSRTRIVGGKITETIGGDLNYYSAKDIINSAEETYTEQSTIGISHSGNPESPPPPKTNAKCIIHFRPNKSWKGEYGFDWPRIGDSKLEVDKMYDGIIGSYGSEYATKPSAIFTPSANAYSNCLREYKIFNIDIDTYYIPYMTLGKDKEAILDVISYVNDIPDKLEYKYDKNLFEVTILKKINKSKGKNYNENALKIKCLNEFSSNNFIEIFATKNGLEEKVGGILILANNAIKNVKVLMVKIEYNKNIGSFKDRIEQKYIVNALNQSLISAEVEEYFTKFTIKGNFFSDLFFTTKNKKGDKVMDTSRFRSLHRYIDDKFMALKHNQDKYSNYYRVYCLPDSLNLNGVAEDIGGNSKVVIAFENRKNHTTVSHELLHAMGLYHTFDNDSKHTFKYKNTNNIMDYTHIDGKDRFTTSYWQWKILRKVIK